MFAESAAFSRLRVQGVFEEAVVGATDAPAASLARAVGRLLYLVHLAVLLWWLLDKSRDQRATGKLVTLIGQMLPSAALALRLPAMRRFVTSLDELIREGCSRIRRRCEVSDVLPRRPSRDTIERFLADSQDLPMSYGPVGLVQSGECRSLDEASVVIGHGRADFERARAALMEWQQFDLGWVELWPRQSPTTVGAVVAVLIKHLGFWSLNGCRVAYHADANGTARSGTPTAHCRTTRNQGKSCSRSSSIRALMTSSTASAQRRSRRRCSPGSDSRSCARCRRASAATRRPRCGAQLSSTSS